VILDANGFSKGYGFVRFADEDEQKDALLQMNGFKVVLFTRVSKILMF